VKGDAVDFRAPVPHVAVCVDGLHGPVDSPLAERACVLVCSSSVFLLRPLSFSC
jgi:hypothetical protein